MGIKLWIMIFKPIWTTDIYGTTISIHVIIHETSNISARRAIADSCFGLMHLSMVCSTSPTWGDGGMIGNLSYGFRNLPHIWDIIRGSFPYISPMSDRSNIYGGASKSQTNIFLVSAQFWPMPNLAQPMGPGFNDKSLTFAPSMGGAYYR